MERKETPLWDAAAAGARAKQPHFVAAVMADAKITAAIRGERSQFNGPVDALMQVLRLMVETDAFVAQVLYRAKVRMQVLGVPVLPWIFHRLAIMTGQVFIGDTVVLHPGVFIGHGMIVIDGFVEIHEGVRIMPGVTIGLRERFRGPTIERDARIGTGARRDHDRTRCSHRRELGGDRRRARRGDRGRHSRTDRRYRPWVTRIPRRGSSSCT